jgi:predicted TIM-barrel fold metal-dependent hydrolase
VIDCDVHCAPPSFGALLPHLPPPWREYVKRSRLRLGGTRHAYPPGAETSGPAAPADYATLAARRLTPDGPEVAILNCLTIFGATRNDHFAAALARALNDWLAHEFLDADPRLRASIAVAPLDPQAAVEEIEHRAGDPRFVQVLLPVRGEEPYGRRRFHPVYAAAARHGLPVALHAWGRPASARSSSAHVATYLEDYARNAIVAQSQLTSLVTEGVFEQYPELRVVLLECSFLWLPPLLWRLDRTWKRLWREVPWLTRPPSEYVHEQVFASVAPAHVAPERERLLEQVALLGTRRLLYASDFPHAHGPGTQALLDALPPADRAAVLQENARSLYAGCG